jgi:CDP-glucose 4,6-dehydratase
VSVLVTGAQGFIGSALAERLLEAGERVVALRRKADPESRFVRDGIEDRCVVAVADLADHDSLLGVLNEHEVSTVFHRGAQTIVRAARRSPLSAFESSVRRTYCLLDACREQGGVERVVVASSDRVYGSHKELTYREDFPLLARYPYEV